MYASRFSWYVVFLSLLSFISRGHLNLARENSHVQSHIIALCVDGSALFFCGAGVASLLGKRSLSFSRIEGCEEMNGDDDLSDDCSQAGEKKKRLNMEQVKTLEKNFELGNKLEPERKMQLARALGLQPRQIAIWFQNRRARWKTKQLEKDYDVLKKQFEAVRADNDALHAQNKKLQAEVYIDIYNYI